MPFKGVIKHNVPTSITLTTPGTNIGPSAATIESVVTVPQINNLKVYTVNSFTAQAGSTVQVVLTLGPNVLRLIIEVALPDQGAGLLRLVQAGQQFEDNINTDTSFVFDVVG